MRILLYILLSIIATRLSIAENDIYRTIAKGNDIHLQHDGVIIGIEKLPRNEIHAPKIAKRPQEQICLGELFCSESGLSEDKKTRNQQKTERKEFRSVVNDKKAMVVTHSFLYSKNKEPLYNTYDKHRPEFRKPSFQQSLSVISKTTERIGAQIEIEAKSDRPYTHLLIMCMGWNNDQYESIRRFNRMVSQLHHVSSESNEDFKPFVIGTTWPSTWFGNNGSDLLKRIGHISSYRNKANDADEVGFILQNYLINHELASLRKRHLSSHNTFPKVVAIGHSFGGRVLTRAAFSRKYLKDPIAPAPIDLLVSAQGAFSSRRFSLDDSGEGAPYRDFRESPFEVVLTTSILDKANPVAIWSKHSGGKNGLKFMRSRNRIFDVHRWNNGLPIDPQRTHQEERVSVYDLSRIVEDHNDILDTEFAAFLWEVIKNHGRKLPDDSSKA